MLKKSENLADITCTFPLRSGGRKEERKAIVALAFKRKKGPVKIRLRQRKMTDMSVAIFLRLPYQIHTSVDSCTYQTICKNYLRGKTKCKYIYVTLESHRIFCKSSNSVLGPES